MATQDQKSIKEAAKQVLIEEAKLGLKLAQFGINYNADDIRPFQDTFEQASAYNRQRGLTGIKLPHGVTARGGYSRFTPYSLVVEDGTPVLYDEKTPVGAISFHIAHPVTEQILSSGDKFRHIANVSNEGGISVAYSSECSLKDLGEDCWFCSINERAKDGDLNKVLIKSPKLVAEAYHLARQAGVANHFRITGGFVPERREQEYYLDVADAIREKYSTFYGVGIIGAPADFSVLPKYKEAGFDNISHNLEVWDRNLFAAICPGKEKRNGGWQHWVDSLEHSVGIFGKGNVHTNVVGGLAPLDSTLEGIEYLASKGVVCHFSAFRPEKGTPLFGYRSQEAWWHWELLDKGTDIYKRYGFTTLQMYSGPASAPHHGQVYQIKNGEFEGDTLAQWKFPSLD
ncbi:MAG: radical SAM protein [Desulfuromonadaceae bacterium]